MSRKEKAVKRLPHKRCQDEMQSMLALVIYTAIEQSPHETNVRAHAMIEGMVIALGLISEPPPPVSGMLDLRMYEMKGLDVVAQLVLSD